MNNKQLQIEQENALLSLLRGLGDVFIPTALLECPEVLAFPATVLSLGNIVGSTIGYGIMLGSSVFGNSSDLTSMIAFLLICFGALAMGCLSIRQRMSKS